MSILSIEHLSVRLKSNKGMVNAVRDTSFSIEKGAIFGLVGESGCGKSVTAKSILKLHNPKASTITGKIEFEDMSVLAATEKKMRSIRGEKIAMIFQDPMTSLDPLMTVGKQISEGLIFHKKMTREAAKTESIELMSKVGITFPEKRYGQYPHEFSGGMLQRIMIATALSCKPQLLIADEPTTALDVTIQAQILKLMKKLQKEEDMAILIITHDLGVVANFCEEVGVMYAGEIFEKANVKTIFECPRHPYTIGLMKAIPRIGGNDKRLETISGMPPLLLGEIVGCPYSPRCPNATEKCQTIAPELRDIGNNHLVRCHNLSDTLWR